MTKDLAQPAQTCWASCLGDCSPKRSREHLVSRGVFTGTVVRVQGLPWCKGEAKQIGLDSVVGKFLCTRHNSGLAAIDDEAATLARAVRTHLTLANERRQNYSVLDGIVRLSVNARRFERWLLKTLINLTYEGPLVISSSGQTPGVPPEDMVRIVFGKASFPRRAGMYVAAYAGMTVDMNEELSFASVMQDSRIVQGGFFTFYGLRFVLALQEGGLSAPLSSLPNLDQSWTQAELKWRFRKIRCVIRGALSHEIRFNWT